MTIEAMRPSDNIMAETHPSYNEELLNERARLSQELGALSIELANANHAYNQCINDIIQINAAITRTGLGNEAVSRLRSVATSHELILSIEE